MWALHYYLPANIGECALSVVLINMLLQEKEGNFLLVQKICDHCRDHNVVSLTTIELCPRG